MDNCIYNIQCKLGNVNSKKTNRCSYYRLFTLAKIVLKLNNFEIQKLIFITYLLETKKKQCKIYLKYEVIFDCFLLDDMFMDIAFSYNFLTHNTSSMLIEFS